VRIEAALLERILAHARRDFPNECCGVVAVRDGRAVAVYEATNVQASPLRFQVDPLEVLRIDNAIEAEGNTLGAIYHSHTRSEPYPSQTDIGFAESWPGVEWLIVGLRRDEDPTIRSYFIDRAGAVEEVEVQVEVARD
jgi:proteasome lid subunit RPN8/RPN11